MPGNGREGWGSKRWVHDPDAYSHEKTWAPWNPLTDDGDALRLAVKLKFTISRNDCECCVVVFGDQDHEDLEVSERFKEVDGPEIQDPYAATRRAIVRAAAAIGEAMP